MMKEVRYRNFKVFQDATLPLGRFTLIIGPNGSGKSAALQALARVAKEGWNPSPQLVSVGAPEHTAAEVEVYWADTYEGLVTKATWMPGQSATSKTNRISQDGAARASDAMRTKLSTILGSIRIFSLNAVVIPAPSVLRPDMTLGSDGSDLAGVLDRLRDEQPERFEALNQEVSHWFPEFDRVLFDTPSQGQRAFLLRTREGHHPIPAADLSQGTLLALTILTLAYLPEPPAIVCLEEPDRGLHPRLLREVQDALYRLAYPEASGEKRDPVQVIATTHSPYFLDLYRDHPEEIVIAHKEGSTARFERLSDRPDIDEILGGAQLGEIWYSGILGGVPASP